jgi:hypothetical protein
MFRLTGCWHPIFEFKAWGNVVCVIEGSALETQIQSHAAVLTSTV